MKDSHNRERLKISSKASVSAQHFNLILAIIQVGIVKRHLPSYKPHIRNRKDLLLLLIWRPKHSCVIKNSLCLPIMDLMKDCQMCIRSTKTRKITNRYQRRTSRALINSVKNTKCRSRKRSLFKDQAHLVSDLSTLCQEGSTMIRAEMSMT